MDPGVSKNEDLLEESRPPAGILESSSNGSCVEEVKHRGIYKDAHHADKSQVFPVGRFLRNTNCVTEDFLSESQIVDPFDCSWCERSVNFKREQTSPVDEADTVKLKPNTSPAFLSDTIMADVSDYSSACASASLDINAINLIKLRDSAPSSVCSASSFDSPTHTGCATQQLPEPAACPFDDSMYVRPDSLCLQRSVLQQRERQWLIAKKGSYSSLSECDSSRSESMDALIEAATSTPLHAQGTVTVDGGMITFVADGINELIKRSRGDSFSEKWTAPRSLSSGSVSSSTSGWSASALSASGFSQPTQSPSVNSPEDIPPIDYKAVDDLEQHARKVACSLDALMETLTNKLFKISSLTHSCLSVYSEAVDNTCDVVDNSIKSMYALMAKCEELSRTVQPVYELNHQIREIKRLLDLFEAQLLSLDA